MNDDGTAKRRVAITGSTAFGPAWSPDGLRLAFQPDTGAAAILTLATGNVQRLFGWQGEEPSSPEYEVYFEGTPAWSPDGTQLAFYTGGINVSPDHYIGWYELASHRFWSIIASKTVMGCGQELVDPVYSPDGTRMAYSGTRELYDDQNQYYCDAQRIYVWSFADGDFVPFASVADDIQIAYAPSGSGLVLTNDSFNVAKLYTSSIDGQTRVFLTNGYQPDWQRIP